ncbi:Endonuclease/exonuclease/phosphatase [Lasiosphaeria ovina]|uniref:Endonuclease/exonuclease/phosphatase n=1 Tax=Lasiosphaeria ovina TaxID=92902 RepID=A0AAE0TXC2_9PEZI|nr:Endonuclease/exonuclease/phosphatase [Lasiosphaeria ovina]
MDDVPSEISVLTLNCWGLKYISKLRRERLAEIGRQIAVAEPEPHIVALQELWTQEDYRSVRRQTRHKLPYAKFYFSGPFGGGLAILSRWPIEESTMFRYPLNGRPTAFFRGDWFVGKGVAHARIRYGPAPKHVVDVFNTHTHAPYEHGPNDSYLAHRLAQAWEMSKLLRAASERGSLVLALGDFNMVPLSLEHRLITAHAPVRDTWRILHPDSSVGPADHPPERARRRPIPTAEFNIRENGAASDGPYNTWRWPKAQQKRLGVGKPDLPVSPDTIDSRGKRLDYVFAGCGDVAALGGGWVVSRVSVGMMVRHPELGCSLSDHFAVEATLVFHPLDSANAPQPHHYSHAADNSATTGLTATTTNTTATATANTPSTPNPRQQLLHQEKQQHPDDGSTILDDKQDDALHNGTYLQSPRTSSVRGPHSFDSQLLAAVRSPVEPLPASAYDEVLAATRRYAARERAQKRWRGAHFWAALAAAVGAWVAVWFSPHNWVSFLLMLLLGSLGLVAGTVDGLLALLFFKSELRALREFEWEIVNAKAALAAAGGGPPVPVSDDDGEDDEGNRGW